MGNEVNTGNNQVTTTTWAGYAAAAFAGGNGSESAPFLIANGAQLAFMAKVLNAESSQLASAYNRKYYKLTGSIDLEQREWIPIGDNPFGRKYNTCFFFDGGGHTVSGLKTSKPGESYQGLFGFADGDSSIQNLNVAGGNVTGAQSVGGIIGRIKGRIENCTFSGQVNGKREVGGIVGSMNYGSICNCINTGIVSCDSYGAGIVGSISGYMQNCSNKGVISGAVCIGGLAGLAKLEGCIESGENDGMITGKDYVGGIVGRTDRAFVLTLCMNYHTINGETYIGGIAGQAELMTYCCNKGAVRGSEILGGVCGAAGGLVYCQNMGSVVGTKAQIGGIAGICSSASDCINSADIRGNGPMGGVAGTCEGSRVKNSVNTGNVSGTGILGGIIGLTTQDSYVISDCYNAGNVSATWASDPILGRHDKSCRSGAIIDAAFYLKGCVERNGK